MCRQNRKRFDKKLTAGGDSTGRIPSFRYYSQFEAEKDGNKGGNVL